MNTNLNYGVNVSIGSDANIPIIVNSSTTMAMSVVADTLLVGLRKFNSAKEGLEWCATNSITIGTLHTSLEAIFLMGVVSPIIVYISTFNTDDTINTTSVSAGLDKFINSKQELGITPELILAPMYSAQLSIATKIDAISARLLAIGVVCSFDNTEANSVNYLANFGSRFLYIGNGVSIVNSVEVCNSVILAGNIVYWDAGGDAGADSYGWAKNHSNRVVRGVEKSTRKDGSLIEFIDSGDSEARRLRQQGMAHIVRDEGWRVYGFETTDINPIWQSLKRVRTFLRLAKTLQSSLKYIRDRNADELGTLRKSVIGFFDDLKGNGVVIGFSAEFETAKNSATNVTAGKFVLTIRAGDMPSVSQLDIELLFSDNWNTLLINNIGA